MKTILHVVDTASGRADLYRALTTQEGLAGWWITQVTASPEVGSIIDFRFDDDFGPDMEITRLEADTTVEWRCVGRHDPWADNTFHFELADLDDGLTRLRLRQDYAQEVSDDAYGVYNYNWGCYLESLQGTPATMTVSPRAARAGQDVTVTMSGTLCRRDDAAVAIGIFVRAPVPGESEEPEFEFVTRATSIPDDQGNWTTLLTIPASSAPGAYGVDARCRVADLQFFLYEATDMILLPSEAPPAIPMARQPSFTG
jgi:uncharacterized protein YndB with AHSA1/START domain